MVLEGGGCPRGAIPPVDLARITAGGRAEPRAGGRRKEKGKGRGLKYPSRQRLHCDTGHRRGEVETRVSRLGPRFCPAPQKFLRAGCVCRVCSGGIFHADPHFGGYFVGQGFLWGPLELLLGGKLSPSRGEAM